MTDDLRTPGDRDFPPGRLQERGQHLVRELAADRSRRRRKLALVVVAGAIALLAVMGFTTYALTHDPTHFESLGCFERADLDANTAILNSDARHPVEVCREVWRTGGFPGTRPPSRLAACVLETGAIGVFPSKDERTCAELGLAPLSASHMAEARRFAELRGAIVARIGAPASGSSLGSPLCIDEPTARRIVRKELDTRGYSQWEIKTSQPFSVERPCTEVAFDGGRREVVLIPVWRD